MSAAQRNKGAKGEREVVRILNESLGTDAQRNLDQTRDGGTDISLPPYGIEVKRRRQMGFYAWMHQAEKACGAAGLRPVVIARADGEDWVAIVPLSEFIALARENIVWERVKPEGCE